MLFKYNSNIMGISDRDVVTRLIHPEAFSKLRLANVTVDGGNIRYSNDSGGTIEVKPVITTAGGVERREFFFPLGRLTIERDGLEMLAQLFHRNGDKVERQVLRCALRDRRLDGTPEASPLSAFPNTHEATNKLPHTDFKCAELSIYCYDPERYLPATEMLDFIMKLDDYLYKRFEPVEFFRLWTRAFEASNMAPWQPAPPLKGVAQFFVENAGPLLAEHGYNRMDAVCGWYNVVVFFLAKMGFTFTHGEHKAAFEALEAALEKLEARIGRKLNLRERAWVVALQNIPAEFIPPHLNLHARWINTPTYTDYVCRIHRDLTPFPVDPRVATLALPKVLQLPDAGTAGDATPPVVPAPADATPASK
jgi:hypothetical protein